MLSFYSPFSDKKGTPIDIFHIQHHHLYQLQSKGIEEGYQIEYKSSLTESVKKKLPKIITSFANSAGGWLFVGVDEKTLEIDRLEKPPRTDCSQILSQLLREHTSPLPHFEARFLKRKGSEKGVLVVYVFEGVDPPYIADGTVYVRNGSSSEPARSQRSEIDTLYQKGNSFKTLINEFCRREIFYPMDDAEGNQVPLCNIYIMNTAANRTRQPFMRLDNLAAAFTSISPNQFKKYIFSSNSVVFQNNPTIGYKQIGINIEIFSDLSAKIHIPLNQLQNNERDFAIERLQYASGQNSIADFLFIDGYAACLSFQYIVQQYFQFLKNQKTDLSTFLYRMSLEDAENSILYFDSAPYLSYVVKHGVPYCCKHTLKTSVRSLYQMGNNKSEVDFISLLIDLFYMFGLSPADAAKMYLAAMKENPERGLTIV